MEQRVSTQKTARRRVPLGARSVTRGECASGAKLTDAEIELIRELREVHGLTYAAIAAKFDEPRGVRVSVSYVTKLCRYERRTGVAEAWAVREVVATPARRRRR
ncbi:MAG: Bordetella virus [Pseudomonadota bacterium]|jgi:hypothetical protein